MRHYLRTLARLLLVCVPAHILTMWAIETFMMREPMDAFLHLAFAGLSLVLTLLLSVFAWLAERDALARAAYAERRRERDRSHG